MAERSALGIAIEAGQWIQGRVRALIPQIGNDEDGTCNLEAREAVAELVRKLATLNWGDLVAEIDIGKINNARQAVGILTKWQKDLLKQIKSQQEEEERKLAVAELKASRSAESGLNPTQAKALQIIKSEGPILGKVLARRLKITEPSLRRHVIQRLAKCGVKNDRNGHGYYLP